MIKQITKFSIHQTSKVLSIVVFFLVATVCVPLGLLFIFSGYETGVVSGITMLFVPLFYLVFSYVTNVIFLFVYNLVSQSFGGIEFKLEDKETFL